MSALSVASIVSKWKLQPLGNGDIPYGAAVYSLQTSNPDVELRRLSSAEWVVSILVYMVCRLFTYCVR